MANKQGAQTVSLVTFGLERGYVSGYRMQALSLCRDENLLYQKWTPLVAATAIILLRVATGYPTLSDPVLKAVSYSEGLHTKINHRVKLKPGSL
jgi:hypothetical protein